ncbi:TolC family protein [Salinicola tamaricis]|uniref:TolC family protein n=1 Tax=Salinicola tamaricis TaxID=1771309 RepID=UPI0013ED4855|nr:TolC family protein [Salinicola tamaricis]
MSLSILPRWRLALGSLPRLALGLVLSSSVLSPTRQRYRHCRHWWVWPSTTTAACAAGASTAARWRRRWRWRARASTPAGQRQCRLPPERCRQYLYPQPDDYPDADYAKRVSGRTRDSSWGLRLSQPLFDLERWRQVDKAGTQVDAATLEVAVAERDLALRVIDSYLDAYQASRKVGLLIAQREALVLQQRQAQRAYELGVGDRINLLESQSRLDQAIADQTAAESDMANAVSDLERLSGATLDFAPALIEPPQTLTLDPEPRPLNDLLALTDGNPQVELAARRQRVAQADTDLRHAARYPKVDLVLDYNDLDSDDPLRTSRDLSAGVEVDLPLYQGGYTTASIRQAELSALAGAAALDDEQRLAQQEVRKRLRHAGGSAPAPGATALHRIGESVPGRGSAR